MAIYDFNEFAGYCENVLCKIGACGAPMTARDFYNYPQEIKEYLADFLCGTYCCNIRECLLRAVRKDNRTEKVTAVVFSVVCESWRGWIVLHRCAGGVVAKKYGNFGRAFADLQDKEKHEGNFYSLFAKGDKATAQLLRKAREK